MGSHSDSTSGLQEELPAIDFLQPHPCATHTENLDLGGAKEAVLSSSAKGNTGARTAKTDVLMISSESDDDAPYVPLAQRLTEAVTKSKQHSPSNLVSEQLPCQINLSESKPLLGVRDLGTVNYDISDGVVALHQRWLQLKHHSGVGIIQTYPVKRIVEMIQASREETLKRKQAMRQKRDKDVLWQKQEKQKVERNALSEAAKAIRPEEYIKHMVVAVDPGNGKKYLTLCRCEW